MKGFKQVPKTEKQMVEEFKRDMEVSQEKKQLVDQDKEFRAYLEGKRVQAPTNEFFSSMLQKLNDGVILTDNMQGAVRKCMTRDVEYNQRKGEKPNPENLPTMTLKVKAWWMKSNNLDSRVVTGKVMAETAKAYLVHGHADMLNDCSWCMRCGKELTQPASYTIGFGEICAGKAGVPYPVDLNTMTAKQKRDYRKKILGVLHNQKIEKWIPKSQVEEVLERKEG